MKLNTEFYKLPLRVDVDQLIKEINAFSEDEWRAHPQQFQGNNAMILIAANGDINDDMQGPMLPTEKLKRCPYIEQILASFNTVIGRSRLMRLAPGESVPVHTDINYYWRDRLRIHIPVITHPSIRFCCNDKEVNMAAGEVWVFDNWRNHTVINPSNITRIHLVADTCGSSSFWKLMAMAECPFDIDKSIKTEPNFITFDPDAVPELKTELHNASIVMHPGEMELLMNELRDDLLASTNVSYATKSKFINILKYLIHDWRSIWSVHGEDGSGWPEYEALMQKILNEAGNMNEPLPVASNGISAIDILTSRLQAAFNPKLKSASFPKSPKLKKGSPILTSIVNTTTENIFDRPVFIVAAPRSGSTFLFESLAHNRDIWTIGGESHRIIEGIQALNPSNNDFHSNRLTASDATENVKTALRQALYEKLQNCNGHLFLNYNEDERPATIRFLEKTPKNALRIPFIKAVFPDALFVYLHRKPRENISSIIDAWRSGRFVTYNNLPDWEAEAWSLLLPPGWKELNGAPINKIAAFQWHSANKQILEDLGKLAADDWISVSYEEFLSDPANCAKRICEFAQLPFGPKMQALGEANLPNSRYTLTPPDPNKWRKNEKEVMEVIADVEPLAQRIEGLTKRPNYNYQFF